MTDQPGFAFTPATMPKRWLVTLSDNTVKTVEAAAIRVEGGALVLVMPAGCVAAWAPGVWRTCEPEGDQ
ncbi:MAG: hypothetical protein U1E60_18965 [Reyranellaceae bacterium]